MRAKRIYVPVFREVASHRAVVLFIPSADINFVKVERPRA
jgi:hypothetical protein